jgi:hypothetical protein
MSCRYDMGELGLPFGQAKLYWSDETGQEFYSLRVCKRCRAEWLAAVAAWFWAPPGGEPVGSGIFVRENGAAREITREEWDRRHPGADPFVIRGGAGEPGAEGG